VTVINISSILLQQVDPRFVVLLFSSSTVPYPDTKTRLAGRKKKIHYNLF